MWAPRGGVELFPEGRAFQYRALSLVSMEMAERPKQEVGFLGEEREDPPVRASYPQSLSYELCVSARRHVTGLSSGRERVVTGEEGEVTPRSPEQANRDGLRTRFRMSRSEEASEITWDPGMT